MAYGGAGTEPMAVPQVWSQYVSPNLKIFHVMMMQRAAKKVQPWLLLGRTEGSTERAWSVLILRYIPIVSAVKRRAVVGSGGKVLSWCTKSELSLM